MKVLIVKASALGDVVHALPVLAWLKSADPAVEIDWLVEDGFASLLDGHPLVRKVHRLATRSWRQQGWLAAIREGWQAVERIRRENYDVVLDLQGNSKSGLFVLLSGASRRYGFDRQGVREWPNLLATNRRVRLTAAEHHISERSLAIARAAFPLGQEHLTAGPLPIRPEAAAQIDTLLADFGLSARRFAVLHYGTTWTTKLWPTANWQTLVCGLEAETGLVPVLTWGSNEERGVVEQLAVAAGGRALLWPRGTLPELAALLARADIVVGGDTGPIHIAAAVGTPTVSMYRVTDGCRNGPRGERHVCLQTPLDCSPCLLKHCEKDLECGLSIPVTAVLHAMQALLAGEETASGRPSSSAAGK
ncbi:MAG: lipopolysaccharide heptosyltransferase I [Desulfuromonadales bacterium]|nr:lipopolysaccharide heptosyltransferase I [Desulfuromonadales bacterium]